ncbi:MAG: GGDEF domain-containing protein, partial [Stellaceae bacterium]
MNEQEELAQARKHAHAAHMAMKSHEIPPTPQNYVVWYSYVAQVVPELNRTIDVLITNNQAFTSDVNADLYARYFDSTGQLTILHDTGGRLRHIVDQVLKHIDSAAGDAGNFGRRLDDFSTAIGDGGDDAIHGLITDLVAETQAVAERNRSLEERLSRASGEVSALKQSLENVQREARTDALTGIPNRKSFDQRLRESARDAMEGDEPLSLLLADIDYFKRFNDLYGHHIGDQVLKLVARTLTDSVKGRDTPARYGGEEFAIILPQTDLREARVVAENIRAGLSRRKLVGRDRRDDYGVVTLSFGAAQYRPGESMAVLIERA